MNSARSDLQAHDSIPPVYLRAKAGLIPDPARGKILLRLLEAPRCMRAGTPRPLGDQYLTSSILLILEAQAPSRAYLGYLDHTEQWGLCMRLGKILPLWELSARNTRDRVWPGLAVTASGAALYSGGIDGGLRVMSDLGKLRAGPRTSSWQRWLTLHLKTATSEPPQTHKNSLDREWGQRWKILGYGHRFFELWGTRPVKHSPLRIWLEIEELVSVPVWWPVWPHPFGGLVLNLPVCACKYVCIFVGLKRLIMCLSVAISGSITSSPDKDLRRLACVVSCQIPWPSWNKTHKVSLHRQDVFPSWSRVEWKVIDAVLITVWLVGNYYRGGPGWRVHSLSPTFFHIPFLKPSLLSCPLHHNLSRFCPTSKSIMVSTMSPCPLEEHCSALDALPRKRL